eukprot:1070-Heterococcus_DN1.PRE.1
MALSVTAHKAFEHHHCQPKQFALSTVTVCTKHKLDTVPSYDTITATRDPCCSYVSHNSNTVPLIALLKAVTDTVKDVTYRAAEATKHAVQKPTEIDPDILAFEDLE